MPCVSGGEGGQTCDERNPWESHGVTNVVHRPTIMAPTEFSLLFPTAALSRKTIQRIRVADVHDAESPSANFRKFYEPQLIGAISASIRADPRMIIEWASIRGTIV